MAKKSKKQAAPARSRVIPYKGQWKLEVAGPHGAKVSALASSRGEAQAAVAALKAGLRENPPKTKAEMVTLFNKCCSNPGGSNPGEWAPWGPAGVPIGRHDLGVWQAPTTGNIAHAELLVYAEGENWLVVTWESGSYPGRQEKWAMRDTKDAVAFLRHDKKWKRVEAPKRGRGRRKNPAIRRAAPRYSVLAGGPPTSGASSAWREAGLGVGRNFEAHAIPGGYVETWPQGQDWAYRAIPDEGAPRMGSARSKDAALEQGRRALGGPGGGGRAWNPHEAGKTQNPPLHSPYRRLSGRAGDYWNAYRPSNSAALAAALKKEGKTASTLEELLHWWDQVEGFAAAQSMNKKRVAALWAYFLTRRDELAGPPKDATQANPFEPTLADAMRFNPAGSGDGGRTYRLKNGETIRKERVLSRGRQAWRWALYTADGRLLAHYRSKKEAKAASTQWKSAPWLGSPQNNPQGAGDTGWGTPYGGYAFNPARKGNPVRAGAWHRGDGAYQAGRKAGHADKLIGTKSDYAWHGVNDTNDYTRNFALGYRRGWDETQTLEENPTGYPLSAEGKAPKYRPVLRTASGKKYRPRIPLAMLPESHGDVYPGQDEAHARVEKAWKRARKRKKNPLLAIVG